MLLCSDAGEELPSEVLFEQHTGAIEATFQYLVDIGARPSPQKCKVAARHAHLLAKAKRFAPRVRGCTVSPRKSSASSGTLDRTRALLGCSPAPPSRSACRRPPGCAP
eukprot:4522771-Alexandrium_andersonii.AAC.1